MIEEIVIHKDNKLDLSKSQKLGIEAFLSLVPSDKKILLSLDVYRESSYKKKKRTEQQNKYYHKLLDIICDYTGMLHPDLHLELKRKFLCKPWITEEKEYLVIGSTRDLTPSEFGDYLEKVYSWASTDLELILPHSSDYY